MNQKPEHIKYNALKNAIYVPIGELMPCIRRCPFMSICYIYDSLFNDSSIYYIGCCPIECAKLLNLREYFSTNPVYATVDKALTETYISLFISIERIQKQICMNPDILNKGNSLSKPYEVLSRLQKKFLKVTREIMDASDKSTEGRCKYDG